MSGFYSLTPYNAEFNMICSGISIMLINYYNNPCFLDNNIDLAHLHSIYIINKNAISV